MPNILTWQTAGWVSRSTVLTTELNSLASSATAWSAAGTEIANQTNLDQWGKLEVNLASITPSAGGFLTIYMITAPGGTNYEDGSATINPGAHTAVVTIPLRNAAGAIRVMSRPFLMEPAKTKFIFENQAGVTLAASGNTVTLYTTNDQLN
jgi:hypothetical protein